MNPHPVTITVTGRAQRRFKPNRCTVHLSVHSDGSTREKASEPVTAAVNTVTDLLTSLSEQPDSPLQRWSLDQLRHDRYRPYHSEAKKRPWVYRSTASVKAIFKDFSALGTFIDEVSEMDEVEVGRINWWLTPKATAKRTAQVRDLAVRNALAKAQGYTQGLGYSEFTAVAIADPGMLGLTTGRHGYDESPMPVAARVMAAPSGYNGDVEERQVIELEPDRITIYADVEARFEAVKTEVETQS
ncbi:UNVERIFIED_CONTAM: hypothetical protein DES50_1126 [Williamsia faeni]